ncbi:response regulator transcription factor [Trichloromonas acetexigens]|jgi:two-component system phosphate regulon response regulator PhoB|uniref:Response regulator transcription factor n=1 Tax=Trichloromonas acetexigens TaxID=38815 RepID=A0A550JBJ2_9BACT|nr:response regulator transcription factor [Desulfuromonas acetexigens]TRO80594.1 response regulator transcription factor [Desulfuromonas acetexigens]
MSKARILVIEDEEDILALIQYNLIKAGYRVECVTSGEEGVAKATALHPDLVILDLMLPGINGFEVCRRLRAEPGTAELPIIMLTAKGEDADIVSGLEIGADDYLTKPFSPQVLKARIQAVLRRRGQSGPEFSGQPVAVHDLVVDPGRGKVLVAGREVELTLTEFRLLYLLAGRPGWVFTRTQIVDAIRGEGYAVTDRAVDVQVVGLRKKLGDAGSYIETVRGVGYRFKE